jgi:hypothetical protein
VLRALCVSRRGFEVKQTVISFWILATGTYLWFMSKAEPASLIEGWFIFVFTLFSAAFAGDILIKLYNIRWYHLQWSDLAGLGALFFLGVVVILIGTLLSALNALGSSWPGFVVALSGIPYFYWVVIRIETKFKQLSA